MTKDNDENRCEAGLVCQPREVNRPNLFLLPVSAPKPRYTGHRPTTRVTMACWRCAVGLLQAFHILGYTIVIENLSEKGYWTWQGGNWTINIGGYALDGAGDLLDCKDAVGTVVSTLTTRFGTPVEVDEII